MSPPTAAAAPGELDTTFGTAGKVTTHIGETVEHVADGPNAAAIQPDDKIVVAGTLSSTIAGTSFSVSRYNADGTLDSSFGDEGHVLTSFDGGAQATAVAIGPSGKIVVAGTAGSHPNEVVAVARYNADGTLDSSFGDGGRVTTSFGQPSLAKAVAISSEGKPIVAGGVSGQVTIVRYNTNGQLDTTFGDGGVQSEVEGTPQSIALDSTGRIVIAGYLQHSGVSIHSLVARYTSGGALDTGFAGTGSLVTEVGQADRFNAVSIDSSDRVVAAGSTSTISGQGCDCFSIVRYGTNGGIDNGFGTQGKVVSNFGSTYAAGYAVKIDSTGRIVVGGYHYTNTNSGDFASARYSSGGVLDGTYGTGGPAITEFESSSFDTLVAVGIDSQGRIVEAGSTNKPPDHGDQVAIARYSTGGVLDSQFGTGGRVHDGQTLSWPSDEQLFAIARQADGKLVAVGRSDARLADGARGFLVTRYNADGTLDVDFGEGGSVVTELDPPGGDRPDAIAKAVAIDSSGRIVVAGTSVAGEDRFALARYESDGDLDTTFGDGGTYVSDESDRSLNALALAPGGKIVVAGRATDYDNLQAAFAVARYEEDGSPDPGFSSDGVAITSFGDQGEDAGAEGTALLIDGSGRPIVVGWAYRSGTNAGLALARYETDGDLDPTFGTGGKRLTLSDRDQYGNAAALDSSGRILVAGEDGDFVLARYDTGGTLDASFGSGGMVTTNFEAGAEGESDDFATAIGADSAGRVVALGFTCCNGLGYRRFAVARYTSGGVLDSTFGSGGLAATAFGSSDAVAFTGLVDGSGRPVAAGYVCCDPTYDLALARWQGGNGAATDRPNTILDSTPDPLTNDTEPDFTFHSTKANSTFECKLYAGTGDGSGVTWEDCDSPHQADALGSDGDYTFKVRAIDANGIHDESPAVATFTLDATAPETILSLPPWGPDGDPDAYVWHSPFPTFTFYSFEPATFRCRIDTGAWTSCGHTESDTDLVDYTAPTALSNGPHTFRVAASDDLGNEDPTPEVATFTVAAGADHDPPDLTILAGTSRLSSSGVATVLLLCPNTEVSGPCTGKLGLKTTKKFGGRKVKLGNASYSIPSGEGDAVQIQLGSKQRALVAKHSPLAAKASTKVSDSAGNSKKVSQALKLSKP